MVCKVLGHPVDVFLDNNMTRVRKIKEHGGGASWPNPSRSGRSGTARTAGYQGGREGGRGTNKVRRVNCSFVLTFTGDYSRVNCSFVLTLLSAASHSKAIVKMFTK